MKLLPFKYKINDELTLRNNFEIDLSNQQAVNSDQLSAVKNLESGIRNHQCLAIMGPVGSGKSLLIKLLADSQLYELGAYSEYPFCAYLSQDLTRMFTGNSIESILEIYQDKRYSVGQHFNKSLFDIYAEKLNISKLIKANRRLMHYSEGERQRLGLCLAAAVEAKVTILDEPTTALNIEHRLALYEMIKGMKKRTQVIIISHRFLDCLSVADYFIRMDKLELKEHFSVEQIIDKEHILSYYLG